jgi:hypothetical protein
MFSSSCVYVSAIYILQLAASSCWNCASEYGTGFTSHIGSATCLICSPGYYRTFEVQQKLSKCVICPSNTICSAYSKAIYPAPHSGYWIDTRNELFFRENVFQVYKCFRPTCKGSSPDDEKHKCWARGNITQCDSDELQCTEGAQGPICGKRGRDRYTHIHGHSRVGSLNQHIHLYICVFHFHICIIIYRCL